MANAIIYDTTLRDGAQYEGVSFSVEDKLEVLRRLDDFGIDFVEGGWPGANPKDDEFFKLASQMELQNAVLTAFGSTGKAGMDARSDKNLNDLASCPVEWCCIFGKSWDFQVTDALQIPLEENLDLIRNSIRFLRDSGKRVMFDAEHFFDGYIANPEYALKCLDAAVKGGAEWVVLCDTNGGTLPDQIFDVTKKVVNCVKAQVGIHCHNDTDVGVANSLFSLKAGATMVQGTINGIGERCGNANLCSIIANLELKLGFETNINDLGRLTDLSKSIGEIANVAPYPNLPYVGDRAFAHKGGMHVSALAKDSRTYEHIRPEQVGNSRKILVSEMAGRASISEKLKGFSIEIDNEQSKSIIETIKTMESEGYQFEGADASFELLVRRATGELIQPFKLKSFKISIDDVQGSLTSEATIKVASDGSEEHTAANGDGPVNALDNALRKALSKFFPVINDVRLTDYKVRVLDEKSATAAKVRVLIRSTDGKASWTTVGVSTNVIEASLRALTDSMEYAIYKYQNQVQ